MKKINIFALFIFLSVNTLTAQEKDQHKKVASKIQDIEISVNEVTIDNVYSENKATNNPTSPANTYNRSAMTTGSNGEDIGMPINTTFQFSKNTESLAQNSVNEVTGKVAFSVPITSIFSGSTGYAVTLDYSGQSAFKTAKEKK